MKTPNAKILALAACAALVGHAAHAQSSLTLYGSVDQYLNHLRSNSGSTSTALEDGAIMRTRMGLRGTEDLGGGLYTSFNLEMGINADNGTTADSGRGFDRQSWLGLGSKSWGELRLGRQGGVIFKRGGYIDSSARTLGSMVNNFGAPSRYDNDIAYISPRVAGFLFEVHYALAETGAISRQGIWQSGLDWNRGPWRVGYAGLLARAPKEATVKKDVRYDNLYANWDYGQGKVYAVFIRSNNSAPGAAGNNAGNVLSGVGGVVAGTNAAAGQFHHIWQLSADYKVQPNLRLGAIIGVIKDQSDAGQDAQGGSLAAYYDLSKRTTLYAVAELLKNKNQAGFRLGASGGIKGNFSDPNDVNGRTIKGVQFGITHRF